MNSPVESPQQMVQILIGTLSKHDILAISMATKTDGTVWYWGINYYGEFGNGIIYDLNYYTSPQQTLGICVTPLSTPIFQEEKGFSLYPNPAATQVTLSYPLELEGATLEIYDLTGRSIAKKSINFV